MNADEVLAAEDRFLTALTSGDTALLREMLDDAFVLIDPISGGETPKAVFLEALDSGALSFPTLKRNNAKVTIATDVAKVVGSAYMQVRLGGDTMTMSVRYTHVFHWRNDRFTVISAQSSSVPGGVK